MQNNSVWSQRKPHQTGNTVEPVRCMGLFGEVKAIAQWDMSTWLFINTGWFPAFKYRKWTIAIENEKRLLLVTPQTHIVPPRDKRITPKCCENVQTLQAVFLDVPDSFYEGDNDTPPKWVISCKSDKFDCDGWRQAHFCPFCGTPVPEIVRVDTGEYKVCTCMDGGDYCDTCKERLRCCQCLPPTHQWGPKS